MPAMLCAGRWKSIAPMGRSYKAWSHSREV